MLKLPDSCGVGSKQIKYHSENRVQFFTTLRPTQLFEIMPIPRFILVVETSIHRIYCSTFTWSRNLNITYHKSQYNFLNLYIIPICIMFILCMPMSKSDKLAFGLVIK